MTEKPILAIDFDGVIHRYTSGWKGATVIPDGKVSGARGAIAFLRTEFRIVIFSARADETRNPGGKEAIEAFLHEHGIEYDDITNEKPPAYLLIDDRAITFRGDWATTAREVMEFSHWFQGKKGCGSPADPVKVEDDHAE
jgi:hypothetical protein